MAAVEGWFTAGVGYTLDAANEMTPWADVGTPRAGLVTFCFVFNSDWNGTLTFQGRQIVNGTERTDPIAATNLVNGTTVASTTVGSASTTEFWRVDASGLHGVRVEVTTYAAGAVLASAQHTIG